MKRLKLKYSHPETKVEERNWKDAYLAEHSRYRGVTIFALRRQEFCGFDPSMSRCLYHRWAVVKTCPHKAGGSAPVLHRIYRFRTLAESKDVISAFYDKLQFL